MTDKEIEDFAEQAEWRDVDVSPLVEEIRHLRAEVEDLTRALENEEKMRNEYIARVWEDAY